ncbi:MAG: cation-translocating P-type ATPase [Candidatus Babeliales bacterium]
MIRALFVNYHGFFLLYIFSILALFFVSFFYNLGPFFIYFLLTLALIPIIYKAILELKKKQLGSEIFFIFATIIGLIAHEERAILIVLLILLIAHYLQTIIEERTENAIESLIQLLPENVHVIKKNKEHTVPLHQINIGDHVLVKTGEKIPVDGIIIEGCAEINEASLTGESQPLMKMDGQLAYAGTYIEAGSIIIRTKKIGKETRFGQISLLIEQAYKQKADITTLADRVARYISIFFIFFIIITWFFMRDLNVIVSLLVFGSPVELILITPLTILAGIAAAFKNGIIVKGGYSLEQLAKTDAMVFDKTGTLTIGKPVVTSIRSINPQFSEQDILLFAAIAEKRSGHVIAQSILKKAKQEGLEVPDPSRYESITGHGIEIVYNENIYLVGNKHFIEAPEHGNISLSHAISCEYAHSTIYVAQNKTICGFICIADEIRQNAQDIIHELKKEGIKSMLILSGDKQEIADQVAKKLEIDNAYGEVMPDEKLKIIDALKAKGHIVTMIGDGINDAPALKYASVGIAMGAMGMQPAIEAADIVLMSNDLNLLVFIYKLAKKSLRIIKQNIFWGLIFTHVLGIILSLLRFLNPVQAALFHAIPEILIFLNTARLLLF